MNIILSMCRKSRMASSTNRGRIVAGRTHSDILANLSLSIALRPADRAGLNSRRGGMFANVREHSASASPPHPLCLATRRCASRLERSRRETHDATAARRCSGHFEDGLEAVCLPGAGPLPVCPEQLWSEPQPATEHPLPLLRTGQLSLPDEFRDAVPSMAFFLLHNVV